MIALCQGTTLRQAQGRLSSRAERSPSELGFSPCKSRTQGLKPGSF